MQSQMRFRRVPLLFLFAATTLLSVLSVAVLFGEDPAEITPRAKPTENAAPLPRANIRIDTNVVLIPVTVTDPLNRFVTGLEQDSFKIFEDKAGTESGVFRQ